MNIIFRKLTSLARRGKSFLSRKLKAFTNVGAAHVGSVRESPGVTLGKEFAQSGRYQDAIRAFQDDIRVDPHAPEAWQGIGDVAAKTGQVARLLDAVSEGVTEWSATNGTGQNDADDRYRRRRGLPVADRILAEFLPHEKFVLLDGGAREAESDARWSRLDIARLEIHGFEPAETECARLNAHAKATGIKNHYYPVGLWSIDGTLPFHENLAGGGSSFMHQNQAVSDRWKFENPTQVSLAREIFRPKCTYDMEVVTVETWARENSINTIDFVKLNVQGGELEILKTAGPVLDTVLGLLAEVSFCESYVDRPFFSDVDVFLRSNGFVFFDLLAHHYIGREHSPLAQQHLKSVRPKLGQLTSAWGQLIEGHALYLRDPIAAHPNGPIDDAAARQALKLACIAEIYGQIEYAFELLHWVSRTRGFESVGALQKSAADTYLRYY